MTVALTLAPGSVYASSACAINVSPQPPIVNLPFGSVPAAGATTFGETFDVNYSGAFTNQTLVLQYQNGSRWNDLQGFQANGVGFTEFSVGLNPAWARVGDNEVRVSSQTCSSSQERFAIRPDPSAVSFDFGTYAAVAAFVGGFILLGRRLGLARFLLLAVPAYMVLAPWTGQRYDVYFLFSSGIRILQHVNPFDPGNPPIYPGPLKWAYPPLYPVYSAMSFLLYQVLAGSSLPPAAALTWPGWATSTYNVYLAYVPPALPLLVFLLKLPMIASAILTGVLLKKMTGSDKAAVMWIGNPLVILVAVIWGQIDPIATLLAVGAIYYFEKGNESYAYLLASFGAAVKVWPALIIPIMLVISFNKHGTRAFRPVLLVLPAALASFAVYGVYGNPINSLFVFAYARGIPTFAGAFTVNGLTWQQFLLFANSPPLPIFLYVGIPAYLLMLGWIAVKKDQDLTKWIIVSVMILFATYNYVNPQYFYWILPLLYLKKDKLASIVFTALPLLFMLFAYDVFYFVSPAILLNQASLGAAVLEELKVSHFYQSFDLRVGLFGLIPTVAYLLVIFSMLRRDLLSNVRARLRLPP